LVHADALYAQLGLWRDAQALAWLPAKIVRKGGPDLPLPYPDMAATHDEAVIALARSATATTLCLDLLAALLHPPGDNAEAQQPYRPWLVKRLGAWRTRCREAARHAGKLSEVELHTLRKRAKRLRLMADLFAPAPATLPAPGPADTPPQPAVQTSAPVPPPPPAAPAPNVPAPAPANHRRILSRGIR